MWTVVNRVVLGSGAVPADDGFGCDNQECLLPAGPAAANDQAEGPVEQYREICTGLAELADAPDSKSAFSA